MSVLATVDSLTVDVITDNMSDTYASKPAFATSEMANILKAGATEISGETLLVANLGYGLRLRTKVDDRRHTLLFDTGTEGAAFIRNCRNMSIDLGEVEEIAVTHGHWDHMGALPAALDAIAARRGRGSVAVHVNPGMFNERGVLLQDGTIFPAGRVPTPAQRRRAPGSSTTAMPAPCSTTISTTAARFPGSAPSRRAVRIISAAETIRRSGGPTPS